MEPAGKKGDYHHSWNCVMRQPNEAFIVKLTEMWSFTRHKVIYLWFLHTH